jgi:hypothetical protein
MKKSVLNPPIVSNTAFGIIKHAPEIASTLEGVAASE